MLMLIVSCVLVGWVALSVVLAVAVGRAAHSGEVEYQDQVFLRGVALEATHRITERQLALIARG